MVVKRKIEQMNYALVAKAHSSMYLMHKYWARKPHNVVRQYIEHYSKKGDIVLDPFCGSGVTAIEAIKAGRKAVAVDLDPIATFITRMSAMPVDIKKLESEFKRIEVAVKDKISGLYETKCNGCGKESIILASVWDKKKNKVEEIRYFCQACKKRLAKKPDKNDLKLLDKINRMRIPYWYPTNKLYYDGHPFIKKEKSETVADLFTKRSLINLSILSNEIQKISNKTLKEFFKFAFTSMIHLASRLCPVRPTRPYSSFWAMHSYWIPPIYMESNVWMLFESAFRGRQGLIKGKTEANQKIKKFKEAKKLNELKQDKNILIKTNNALMLLPDLMKPNSVDYIFTDPPYGGAVQYFELATLWASWLKLKLDYDGEVTVNRNQEKDFNFYHKMLKSAFKQMYIILKPGKYLTVTFHSTDIKTWNSIIRAVASVGFELEKIIYQPPARTSAKGLLQPYGSAVGDYYIRFRKPEKEKIKTEREMDLKEYEWLVIDSAKHIIQERGEPTSYQHILNGIMVDLKGGRNIPIGAPGIEDVLKKYVSKTFELISIKDNKGKVIGKKWWIKGKTINALSKESLSDRVERAVLFTLDKKIKVSFDDILQAIFIQFPNAQTPDTQDIKQVLEEYAKKTPDGKWMLMPEFNIKQRKTKHAEMIYYLAKLGKKAGFDICIGRREQSDIYNNERLSSLADRTPTFRYIEGDEYEVNRILQIDVIWHDSGRIKYIFEVENTTGITDAIIRGSNVRPFEGRTDLNSLNRFIIIPEERSALLHRKLSEPIIRRSLEKDKWEFMLYDELSKLYRRYSRKKEFNAKELNKIAREPKLRILKQEDLKSFVM